MLGGLKFLAVIPARAGSKRLLQKNILPLAGKPLVTWTIQAAKDCKYIDDIVVTSDSDEVIEIAKKMNVHVPFKRPASLSSDTASSVDVVSHVVDFLKNQEQKIYDCILLLQPTSPLRTGKDIEEAIEEFIEKKATAVVSVCAMDHSPLWANTLPADLSMKDFLRKDIQGVRSQDLPVYYRINGAIYICKREEFQREQTFFSKDKIFAHVMSAEKSVDIDSEIDLVVAEALIAKGRADELK